MKRLDLCESARNLARLLVSRHNLAPPVDVVGVLEHYADVEILKIPFQFDGIALDLKSGVRPKVILNSSIAPVRLRFTAAHELGHVVIPWHRGIFFDDDSLADSDRWANVDAYMEMERQANAFASELLMPLPWLETLISREDDLASVQSTVIEEAQVSALAAAINLIRVLPPGHVCAVTNADGIVVNGGRSEGTHAPAPKWKELLPENSYSYSAAEFRLRNAGYNYIWWSLPTSYKLEEDSGASTQPSDWREILDGIVHSFQPDESKAKKFKAAANGVVAFVNGDCKRKGRHDRDGVFAAAVQRFNDRKEYALMVQHPSFYKFLDAKVRSLFEGK